MINTLENQQLSEQKARVLELEAELKNAHKYIARLEVVQEVAQSLTLELNLDPLLHKILSAAVMVTQASAGSLLLFDDKTNELEFAVVEGGGGQALQGVRISSSTGIAGWVATNRQPLIVPDVNRDTRYFQNIAESVDFKLSSLLCVPMICRGTLIGVLQVVQSMPDSYFGNLEQDLLTTFASQAAISIENARLYESLKTEQEKLIAVEHEIRKRIARDLHVGPTQFVSSIIISLNFVKTLIDRAPEQAPAEINQTVFLAHKTLKQLRTLLFDLRPVILETQGLIPALQVYTNRLQETDKLNITLKIKREFKRLTPKAEVAIFAVIQEAVNNAKKYANASKINLTLKPNEKKDTLTVLIKDNGNGFDINQASSSSSVRNNLGMLTMQERTEAIDGTFNIRSTVGHGTEVILNVPLTTNTLTK